MKSQINDQVHNKQGCTVPLQPVLCGILTVTLLLCLLELTDNTLSLSFFNSYCELAYLTSFSCCYIFDVSKRGCWKKIPTVINKPLLLTFALTNLCHPKPITLQCTLCFCLPSSFYLLPSVVCWLNFFSYLGLWSLQIDLIK